MFNKVVLVGNLTRNIEIRYLDSGLAIGSTAIAVTRKFNAQNGEKREETCFVDITFMGRQAEVANQYLTKGSKLLIEGRLKFDQWQDQQGNSRSKHSIIVESMEMLGGGNSGNYSNQNNFNQQNNDSWKKPSNFAQKANNYGSSNYETRAVEKEAEKYQSEDTIPF